MAARRTQCRHDLSSWHQCLARQQRHVLVAPLRRTEVSQDFARIRTAGFDTVRFFRRWEDFQPTPERVAPAMLITCAAIAGPGPGYVGQRVRAPGVRASAESLSAGAGSPHVDLPQDMP